MMRGGGGGGAGWAPLGSSWVEYPWMWIYAALTQHSWPSWQSRAYPASSIPLPPSGSTSEVPGPWRCCERCFFAIFWAARNFLSRLRGASTPRPCLGRWRAAGWEAGARALSRDLRGRSRPRPTMPPPVTSPLRSQRRGSRASRSLGCRRRASLTSTCTTQVSFSREPTGGWKSPQYESVKEFWIWIWKGERASVSQWIFSSLGRGTDPGVLWQGECGRIKKSSWKKKKI